MRKHRAAGLMLLGCIGFGSSLPTVRAEPPPVEAFFRQPDFEDAKLSPSGRWLAIAAGGGSRIGLIGIDLEGKEEPRLIARFGDADIFDFEWVNDERLVFRIVDREAGGGDQRFSAGLFSVRRNGDDLRLLIQLRREFFIERRLGPEPLPWNHALLEVPRNGGDEVIVGEFQYGHGQELQAIVPKRLNVVTQRATSLGRGAPDYSTSWLFDPGGEARLASASRAGRTTIHWRAPGQTDWAQVASFPSLEADFTPRFVDQNGTIYASVSVGKGGYGELRRFDVAAGSVADATVARMDGFSFEGHLVVDPQTGRSLGLRLVGDAETTHWYDPRLKAVQKRVDARFQGRINRLTCGRCDSDDMVVLVRSWSDRDPGFLFVYRVASDKWEPIGALRKGIEPAQMATLDLHRVRARDGLELPVWVTLPKRTRDAGPLPAVVLVHGGPWLRGVRWRWNAEAQFLASRGYVVIEPEYRGSTGYGSALFHAGWKQWGRAMQDDLVDAVQWAAGKGWVDPKRVCIAGGSYGGYATLMGLIRHPDVFRCGAAWAAVTDPRLMFKWTYISDVSDEARSYGYPTLIGDPVADASKLAEVAPVELAARIKAPLLLAFGGQDRRVPLTHGTRMREALQAAGQEPEWILYPEEGHGWLKAENRLDFYSRLERFLAEQLR